MSYLVLPPALMERWDDVQRYRFCALPWLDQEMMHLFMSSPEWARYERTTVSSYRKRHDTLIASIHEHLGDKVRIVGADAGLHILLGDGEKRDQSELINLARSHDVRVYGTNRYWVGSARPMRNYVLVGFSQIREEDVPRESGASARPGTADTQRCHGRLRACACENERAPASRRGGGTLGRRERKLVFTNWQVLYRIC